MLQSIELATDNRRFFHALHIGIILSSLLITIIKSITAIISLQRNYHETIFCMHKTDEPPD